MLELLWFVAHTRPRREKKLKQNCEREGIPVTLPTYRTRHEYRRKSVVFTKPLFPGYVFVQLAGEQRQRLAQNEHVASLLEVYDQALFSRQLGEVLRALDTDLEVFLAPEIGDGSRVLVKSGPLRGMEGWVEKRYGPTTVLLRIDFIGQAAAIKVEATQLELG
jgi:transcription antitermination factor NusG